MGLLSSIELLMIGGAIFVAFGFIGLAFRQNRKSAVNKASPTQELTPNRTAKGYAGIRVCRSQTEGEAEVTRPWTDAETRRLRALARGRSAPRT